MAITTVDGVIAGLQAAEDFTKANASSMVAGRYLSFAYTAGRPGAASVPSPGMAGVALTTLTGQIPFNNGAAKQYLARLTVAFGADSGVMVLYDRLWHNSGIDVTSTSAQTINSVAWPARDSNASTNGEGVRIALEMSTATGAGASTHSISYTNQAGTAGRTGSPRVAYAASSIAGAFYDYTLDAGDTGVRSIETFTSSVSMTSGVVHLVAYREIAHLPVTLVDYQFETDAITCGMPELFDDSVPFLLFLPRGGSSPDRMTGTVVFTNG